MPFYFAIDELKDNVTRHQVFLQRYANGLGRRYAQGLISAYRKLIKQIKKTNVESSSYSALIKLQATIESELLKANKLSKAKILKELEGLAKQEAAWAAELINAGTAKGIAASTPTTAQLVAVVSTASFQSTPKSRVNLDRAFTNLGAVASRQARQVISDGILLGETNQQIAANLTNQVGLIKSRATTLARTGTNLVSNEARQQTYIRNRDIAPQYQWVATLDSRTTAICSSRDGQVYDFGGPEPPAHYNCRSTTVPVIAPELQPKRKEPPKRPAVGAKGAGQVPAGQTYGTWLKAQPAAFQDEYFSKFKNGSAKAKLFRQGGLKIDKFVDSSGAEYNLGQLRSLYPLEFAKANI